MRLITCLNADSSSFGKDYQCITTEDKKKIDRLYIYIDKTIYRVQGMNKKLLQACVLARREL